MQHYWVAFEMWAPEGDCYLIAPHTWVEASSFEEAEKVARLKLKEQVRPEHKMTTCVPFTDEMYQAEQERLKKYYKTLRWHPSHLN